MVKKSLKRLKRKIYFKHIVIATVALCLVVGLGLGFFLTIDDGRAKAFSGIGTGSTEDPYQINSCSQLQEISLSPTSNYILTNDINCSATTTWNSGQGFAPISGLTAGSLDGRNHTITNLYMNRDTSSLALFISIDSDSTLKNIKMVGGSVRNQHTGDSSNQKTASLVAYSSGNVNNVSSSVDVRATGAVGGLVAVSAFKIKSSSSSGNIVVDGSWNSSVGGLLGTQEGNGSIDDSFSSSNILVTDDGIGWTYNCGGLVGENKVGNLYNYIAFSYAVGSVDCEHASTNGAGGLVGSSIGTYIGHSFSAGRVYGVGPQYGGLIGKITDGDSLLINSYYDVTSSQQANCSSSIPEDCAGVNIGGLSSNYFKNNVVNPPLDTLWDFTTIWQTDTEYPQLRSAVLSPEKPQNLVAQAYGTKLSLSWDAPFSDGGSPVTSYTIQYKKNTDTDWSGIDNQTATSVDIPQLLPSTTYDVRIIAVNDIGGGVPTSAISSTTLLTGISPPTSLNAPGITFDSVTLNWVVPQNNSGEAVTEYRIDYRTNSNWTTINHPVIDGLSHTVTGLSPGTNYKFRIAAMTQNQLSAWSPEFRTTTDELPERFSVEYSIPRAVSYPPILGPVILTPPDSLDFTMTLTYGSGARTNLDTINMYMSLVDVSNVSVIGGTADDTGTYDFSNGFLWTGLIRPGQTIRFAGTFANASVPNTKNVCTSVFPNASYQTVNVPIVFLGARCYNFNLLYPQTDIGLSIAQEGATPEKIGDTLRYKIVTTNIGNNIVTAVGSVTPQLDWYVALPNGYSYQSVNNQVGCFSLPTDANSGAFAKYLEFSGRNLLLCRYTPPDPLNFKIGDKIEFTISGVIDNTIFVQRNLTIKGLVISDRDVKGYLASYLNNNDNIGMFEYQSNNVSNYTTSLPITFVSPSAERLKIQPSSRASATGSTPQDAPIIGENNTRSNKQPGAAVEGLKANAPRSLVERLAQIIPASAAQVLPYGLILLLLVFAVLYCLDALGQYRQQQEVMLINQRIKKTKQTADDFIKLTTHYLNTPVAALGSALELIENSGQQSPELVNKLKQQCRILSSDVKNLVDTNIQEVQTSSAVKDSLDSATKTLRNRRIWLPIVLVMACLAGSNLLFIKGNVYDASIVKLAVQAVVFVLSCLLIIFGYQYGQRFKKNVVLVRNVRDEETKLLAQKRVFVVVSYQKIHADYKDLLDLSTKLVPSQPTDFFVRGLKQLGALTTSMGSISHFMNTSTDAPLCNISDHITNMVQQYIMVGQQKKIQIVADIQPSLVSKIKKEEVDQLMKSVIDNAIKFTPDGGKIVVSAKRKGKQIILSVSDTGKGIAKDKLPTLLEPFARGTSTEQYDYEGIGLDLYTDKVILSKLGGDVQMKSQEGHGTTVTHTFNIQNDNKALAPVIIVPVTS